ncbi:MAG: pilin [Burkholderiaceae bacterium]|nr:MAG: pilin [Burkholderiaceae bacterium]MBE7427171.1 pilin [Ideonella sp.]MCC7285521.1 pilin [Burkholderiaceae bacterium]
MRNAGFTLIELMVAVAVLAILATLALPSFQGPMVRQQIVDSSALINVAKTAVSGRWSATQTLPVDNAGAGLPDADKLVGNYVSSIRVEAGAVHVVFGNQANGALKGKTLSFRPAVVDAAPMVPIAWVCGSAPVPGNMSAKGADRTDVAAKYLPLNCRAG